MSEDREKWEDALKAPLSVPTHERLPERGEEQGERAKRAGTERLPGQSKEQSERAKRAGTERLPGQSEEQSERANRAEIEQLPGEGKGQGRAAEGSDDGVWERTEAYACGRCINGGSLLCEKCFTVCHPGGREGKPTRFVQVAFPELLGEAADYLFTEKKVNCRNRPAFALYREIWSENGEGLRGMIADLSAMGLPIPPQAVILYNEELERERERKKNMPGESAGR